MRKVRRVGKPPSLEKNAKKWTVELLAAIKKRRKCSAKVIPKLYDRYRCEDVQDALNVMYKGFCCYCEAKISPVSFDHIEHRHPKKKYPKQTYDWENLHLACTICNVCKGDQFSPRNSILDAAVDLISGHLSYRVDKLGVWRTWQTPRGKTTCEHANLNRKELRFDRRDIFLEIDETIKKIHGTDDSEAILARERLEALCDGEYGSVIRWALEREFPIPNRQAA